MLRLGVHVSIAGNIHYSIDRAHALGCNTMQIFARSPRAFRKTPLDDQDIKIFKEKVKKEKIKPVVIHIPYTLNLAATRQSFYRLTISEFIQDLIDADKLGAQYLVTHMGSYKGATEYRGLRKVVGALGQILEATPQAKTMILLENTSGSGHWLGAQFSHHRVILEKLSRSPRIGICLDTAHAWGAGYPIDSAQGVGAMVDELDKAIGISRLKVMHLNDTEVELDSRRDRHFDIGKGRIGTKGFSSIVNHPLLKDIAFILETPKKSDDDDKRNLKTVRKLYSYGVLKGN